MTGTSRSGSSTSKPSSTDLAALCEAIEGFAPTVAAMLRREAAAIVAGTHRQLDVIEAQITLLERELRQRQAGLRRSRDTPGWYRDGGKRRTR